MIGSPVLITKVLLCRSTLLLWIYSEIDHNLLLLCEVLIMQAIRNLVIVGLSLWAVSILWTAICKLRSGLTAVSYEQKHANEVLYPSVTVCPTYSTLGSFLHPKPPKVYHEMSLLILCLHNSMMFSVIQRSQWPFPPTYSTHGLHTLSNR